MIAPRLLYSLTLVIACSPVGLAAQVIGVTMINYAGFSADLAQDIRDAGASHAGLEIRMVEAKENADTQKQQVADFISQKVDALIVQIHNSDDGLMLSRLAADAGIPLVFVNSRPINVDHLPPRQTFVASDEKVSGTLEMQWICKKLGGKGKVSFLIGDLMSNAARERTLDYYQVLDTPECAGLRVLDEAFGNWAPSAPIVQAWLSQGRIPDAIAANNDVMALSVIDALKASGLDPNSVLVGGVDAIKPALESISAGVMDVTVFQNAKGQATGAVDAALKLISGATDVPTNVYVPFELVTSENVANYLK